MEKAMEESIQQAKDEKKAKKKAAKEKKKALAGTTVEDSDIDQVEQIFPGSFTRD